MGRRDEVLAALAVAVLEVERAHPVRVAVDGCSAAGKTTLGDELAEVLRGHTAREVIRVNIDRFKRAVAARTRFPHDSPDSYYHDSWDNDGIRDELLVPLGPDGSRLYRHELMDFAALTVLDGPPRTATGDAILVADGCFLQRPELDVHWDLRIFVDIPLAEVLRRGVVRDQAWMGSAQEAERRYRTKYIPGERRYLDEVRPHERAQLVVDNRDFTAPRLTDRRDAVHRGNA
ncbi:uridylate kinase [Asanoa iriomotensis]|uniref:Uridine kinase n=1 Tax=Asanoa iriomotensis TaxID=234613 RepID=A0ABQ4CG11_9ACTN|nr:uridylate kinase [Asanoa iriomotensis]GIF61716.1 uridine kinase [Asanoa iriomotensis]